MVFCFAMAALCYVQLFALASSYFASTGSSSSTEESGCVGTTCYETFSCYGTRSSTEHFRQPWIALSGAVLFPIGYLGATNQVRWQIRYAANYMCALAIALFVVIFFDCVYTKSCDAYPTNVVHMTLTETVLPPPITKAAVSMLRDMSTYSVDEVSTVTGGFRVLLWYVAVAGTFAAALAYTSTEATQLIGEIDSGPLGLGINYGLDRWSEVVDHDAIRRYKERQMDSKFISDAMTPLHCPPGDIQGPFGYQVHKRDERMGYGSFHPIDYLESLWEPNPMPGDPDQILYRHGSQVYLEAQQQLRFLEEAEAFKHEFHRNLEEDYAADAYDAGLPGRPIVL